MRPLYSLRLCEKKLFNTYSSSNLQINLFYITFKKKVTIYFIQVLKLKAGSLFVREEKQGKLFSFLMKDNEILNRIESGDESALEYLYKKYYRMMVKMIIRNSGTEDEAKDIYQEALIVFWQNVTKGKFVLTSKISTYLYSICQNLWRKELERKGRFSNEEIDLYTKKVGVELKSTKILDIDRKEKTAIINQCIQQLGETCRKILTYYYFDQFSMKKIAEMMGFANADTAKTKKYKCKKQLDKIVKSKYTASDFLD